MWDIIIGIIGIVLIILSYFIADIKKHIREWRRGNRGLCTNCGTDGLRVYKERYHFCDNCHRAQDIRKIRLWRCPKCSYLNKEFPKKKTLYKICKQCGDAYPDPVPSSVE